MEHGFVDGKPVGDIATAFAAGGLSVHNFRPFIAEDGKSYVNQPVGRDPKTGGIIFNARRITQNAALRRDEWKALDMAVMKEARNRLVGVADLQSRGLTYNLTNGMGRTVLEYHDLNDPGQAEQSMDAVARGKMDLPNYETKYIPLPITFSDFDISQRLLETSRNMGDALDTTMAEACTRRVAEKIEDMLFTDVDYTYGGGTIYSYLNQPNINEVSIGTNWDDSGADPVANMIAAKQASIDAKHYGPWVVYIPTAYETVLDEDYVTGYPKTIRQRILEIEGMQAIRVADSLTADNVLLVEMQSNVVRLINGLDIKVVQWASNGGFINKFKVLTIQVPQIRADQAGNSGIVKIA